MARFSVPALHYTEYLLSDIIHELSRSIGHPHSLLNSTTYVAEVNWRLRATPSLPIVRSRYISPIPRVTYCLHSRMRDDQARHDQ